MSVGSGKDFWSAVDDIQGQDAYRTGLGAAAVNSADAKQVTERARLGEKQGETGRDRARNRPRDVGFERGAISSYNALTLAEQRTRANFRQSPPHDPRASVAARN
jgi:hypothetical protein